VLPHLPEEGKCGSHFSIQIRQLFFSPLAEEPV
jgi:hypothetical protein